MIEHHAIQRLATTLHYWTAGPVTGPLVAFVHGATLDHRSFDAQLPALVEAGYRVLTVDLRGHGESMSIGAPFAVDLLADDLLALIDGLKVSRVALVGHSFGGYVVQNFTYRYPERVSCVALVGCTNLATKSSPIFRQLYKLFPKVLSRMSLATFRKRTLAELSLSNEVKVYAAHAMNGISKDDFVVIIMAGLACLWLDSGFGRTMSSPNRSCSHTVPAIVQTGAYFRDSQQHGQRRNRTAGTKSFQTRVTPRTWIIRQPSTTFYWIFFAST